MRHTRNALLASCFLLAACGGDDEVDVAVDADTAAIAPGMGMDTAMGGATAGGTATAAMRDASGKELGTVTLTEQGQVIQLTGSLNGVPAGTHAIHIHMTGQCEAPSFDSAGGHWNPTNQQHGSQVPGGPHLGDLPNLEVGADGTVAVQASSPQGATLQGANGLMDADGAAVVIHAGADDYQSQPSGDAGARIACGVITAM